LAVRKYSGGWSESKFAENKRYLLDALSTDDINVSGDVEWARYDSPFKPWFLRRNEIWVPVEWPAGADQGANR
ncbi:MAG: heme-binding protein, partial [Proteobacteria bacterium]|nr:heme-binding protein [Pseudomonadota bacterium]